MPEISVSPVKEHSRARGTRTTSCTRTGNFCGFCKNKLPYPKLLCVLYKVHTRTQSLYESHTPSAQYPGYGCTFVEIPGKRGFFPRRRVSSIWYLLTPRHAQTKTNRTSTRAVSHRTTHMETQRYSPEYGYIPEDGDIAMIAAKNIRKCLPPRFAGKDANLLAGSDALSNTAKPAVDGMGLD